MFNFVQWFHALHNAATFPTGYRKSKLVVRRWSSFSGDSAQARINRAAPPALELCPSLLPLNKITLAFPFHQKKGGFSSVELFSQSTAMEWLLSHWVSLLVGLLFIPKSCQNRNGSKRSETVGYWKLGDQEWFLFLKLRFSYMWNEDMVKRYRWEVRCVLMNTQKIRRKYTSQVLF